MTEPLAARALVSLTSDPRRLDLVVASATAGLAILMIVSEQSRLGFGWPETTSVIGVFGLVLNRRRAPFGMLLTAIGWTVIYVAVWERPTPMIFGILALLVTCSVRVERWPAIGIAIGVAAALYTVGLTADEVTIGDERAVIGIAWTFGAAAFADAVRTWRRYRSAQQAEMASSLATMEARALQRVAEERLTIARELHDLLSHNLSVMNIQTAAALHVLYKRPAQAEASLRTAREAGRTVLDELHQLLGILRDTPTGHAPTPRPTAEDLDQLVATMRETGLAITWTRSGSPQPLGAASSLAAYRITQEGLTNAAKHGVGPVNLTTAWDRRGLNIRVTNAIREAPGVGMGLGVIGMTERAQVSGGRLQTNTVAGRFEVDAWLPASDTPPSEPTP